VKKSEFIIVRKSDGAVVYVTPFSQNLPRPFCHNMSVKKPCMSTAPQILNP